MFYLFFFPVKCFNNKPGRNLEMNFFNTKPTEFCKLNSTG